MKLQEAIKDFNERQLEEASRPDGEDSCPCCEPAGIYVKHQQALIDELVGALEEIRIFEGLPIDAQRILDKAKAEKEAK